MEKIETYLLVIVGIVGIVAMTTIISAAAIYQNNQDNAGFAGKTAQVMAWSNGFPSGEHFNLNIHGKKSGFMCDSSSGGASIFVQEYGTSEIQYIQNRKSSITTLTILDSCAMRVNDPAKVQLPYGEYQVYARILAKPGNNKKGETRSVILYPKLIDACNDNSTTPIDGFGDYVDCSNESLIGLGVVTSGGAFDQESGYLERLSSNSKALDMTGLFTWSGYACDGIYDTNMDGQITLSDLNGIDLNGDGVLDSSDLAIYLDTYCKYYNSEWIFNIADLVVYGWDYQNSGSKLVQVRFYPKSTTSFK